MLSTVGRGLIPLYLASQTHRFEVPYYASAAQLKLKKKTLKISLPHLVLLVNTNERLINGSLWKDRNDCGYSKYGEDRASTKMNYSFSLTRVVP